MKFALWIGVLTAVVANSPFAAASEFCDEFARGYITGYKQTSGSSRDPRMPRCPRQPRKQRNDPQNDFERGYIIGLADDKIMIK
ncbi:MAG: hypothetical protein R3C69_06340 [Geminicoccaceae bacterium]